MEKRKEKETHKEKGYKHREKIFKEEVERHRGEDVECARR